MLNRRALLCLLFLLLPGLLISNAVAQSAAPVVFFTDLESGPAIGGEGLVDGAFVCLYGRNFGSSRDTSTVTIGGAEAAQYKLWSDPGAPYSQGAFAKACVQVSHLTNDGAQVIQLTTANGASNTVPFTVRSGSIWWVATSGDDTNGDGSQANPWATITHCKNQMAAGDICVIQNGVTVSTMENWQAQIWLNSSGSAGLPKALVAYPGATVLVSGTTASGSWASSGQLQGINNYGGGTANCGGNGCSYWTIAGFSRIDGSNGAIQFNGGSNLRLVDNDIVCHGGYCTGAGGGVSGSATDLYLLGNRIHDVGCHEDANFQTSASPCAWASPSVTISTVGFTFKFSGKPAAVVGNGFSSTIAEGDVILVNGELHRIVSCDSQCIVGLGSGLLDSSLASNAVAASFQYRDFVPTKFFHGVYLNASSRVWMGWNLLDGSAGKACRGIQFYAETSADGHGAHDVHLHDNWIHDTVCDAINLATIDPSQGAVEVYNNVIYRAGLGTQSVYNNGEPVGGMAHYSCVYSPGYVLANGVLGTGALQIYNNTLYHCAAHWPSMGAISVPNGATGQLFAVASNNLIYSVKSSEAYFDISTTSSRFCTGASAFCPGASQNNMMYGGSASAPSYLINSIVADPKLKSPPLDFHLNGFGFAVGGGTSALASLADLDGLSRGSVPSVGAYEYVRPAALLPTTATLAVDVNPQNVGTNVTYTITIAGSGPNVPTGVVVLYDGWTALATAPLDGTGSARVVIGNLRLGSHNIRILYSGDSNFDGSRAVLTQVIGRAVASISTSSLSFMAPLNVPSAAQYVTLHNTGTGPLGIFSIFLSGAGASQFSQSGNCPLPGSAGLAPGASCTISVTFNLTTVSTKEVAYLNLNLVTPASSKRVALVGKMIMPTYTLSANTLSFGNQAYGDEGTPQSLVITNTSTQAALTITDIVIPSPFALFTGCGTFPVTVAAGDTCVLNLAFNSLSSGSSTGLLQVKVAAPAVSKKVVLKGTTVLPIATTYATGLNFGPVTRGTVRTLALTVINPAGNPVMSNLIVSFHGSSDFFRSVTSPGSCASRLSGNSKCTINIIYAPGIGEGLGAVDTGSITVSGSQSPLTQSQTVTLTGIAY